MAKQRRGSGCVYLPSKESTVYWCQYYLNGQRQRESTGTHNKRKAEKYLEGRIADVHGGNSLGASAQKVTVTEIVEAVIARHKLNGNQSTEWDDRRWTLHLKPFFGRLKASQVTTALIDRYTKKRLGEEIVRTVKTKAGVVKQIVMGKHPEPSTINRELALLRSSYWLAFESTPRQVAWVPTFHLLKEDNVRKGFLKDEKYIALAEACGGVGLWLRSMFEIYYTYGWRKNEPLEDMRVRLLDFSHRTITIEDSKNGEGRTVKMTQKVFDLLKACCEGKNENDWLFTRSCGNPVKDFRGSWYKVCCAAGVGKFVCRNCGKEFIKDNPCPDCKRNPKYVGLHVHDLRRTGARNLRRAGVDRDVIRRITGHKTDSMFTRYNIVDEHDLADAMTMLENAQRENGSRTAIAVPATGATPNPSESANVGRIN